MYLGKRKRKLLNGAACQIEAALLNKALLRHSFRRSFADCMKKLKEPSTLLCIKCQNLLLKSKTLEEELQVITQQIDQKIEVLMCEGSPVLVEENSNQSLQGIRIPERAETLSEVSSTLPCIPSIDQRKRSAPSEASVVESSPDVSVSTE